jgi:hypothetical protein
MARMKLTITSRVEVVEDVARRVKTGFIGPAFREVSKALNDSLDAEFRQAAWRTPQGTFKPWRQRHPLSTATGPLLGGVGGSVRQAWKIFPSTRGRVVARSRHPGASVHRGSARGRVGEITTRIMPRRFTDAGVPLMFYALLRKGIVARPARLTERGVEVPSRPHGGANPQLRRDVNQRLLRVWLRGK